MIDFTNYPTRKKAYGGANGSKISIVINKNVYMLKLPIHTIKNKNLSYSNSSISEYLGCHIFQMLGIDAQDTILGKFIFHGKERIVVACKDFVKEGFEFFDFASIKNQIIDSKSNGYGTELSHILETIEKQTIIDSKVLNERFWDIFIVDALIGNWDRHNGNWGFLYKNKTDTVSFAPIYDCGSCLFPQIDESKIKSVLKDKQELNARIFDFPTSAIMENDKRINYSIFLSKHKYKECDDALERISKRVKINEINKLIDSIDCISLNHKKFLKLIIDKRYQKLIIDNIKRS